MVKREEKPSQTPPSHHLPIDPHSSDHVQQQQHSTITTNMSLTAEREAYLRLAAHSMETSRQVAPNFNIHSPKAYGGYITIDIYKHIVVVLVVVVVVNIIVIVISLISDMEGDVVLLGLMGWNAAASTATQFIPFPTTTEVCYELLTGAPPPQNHAGPYDQQRTTYVNGLSSSSFDQAQQQTLSDTNLYIKNLPPEYSDKDLAALVEGCGKIKSMKAIIDKQTNKCKGFGFIDFESHEDAQNAITELQKKGYTAQLAKSSQQQEQDETNLYFANLDLNMTEQDLRQALSDYGNVVSVRILRDQQKQSRGVGFARMNDKKQCQEIIDQFHNKTFPNFTDKPVQVKFADASKNKKLYKSGLDDMKSGPPLYSPMEQTGSYPPQAVLYSPWTQISPQQVPVHTQSAPQHPMYGTAAPLRSTLTVPLPVQQLQQLQIANGHPGAYCVPNRNHNHNMINK
ncbi:unnamed protein product [Rotaria sordida]|uniref:RRM domain-containing protein n=1 Tax=Rotaria sordida TaxID=392033 RepID=A0A815EJ26_9BILA|nr:unnamed protein product [Rotaria sordida]